MALVCPELSLDLKPSYVPETINGFLREVSMISDASQKLDKLDHFVKTLEDEMNKIHVFKRELPLCMLLLRDAILFIKQEITQYKTRYVHQPVLEEFIPLKKDSIGVENSQLRKTGEEDCGRDKKNWMSSVQLWSADDITTKSCAPHSLVSEAQKGNQKVGDEACKSRGGSKGVVSLVHNNPDRSSYSEELRKKVEKEEDASVGGLTLVVPGMMKHSEEESIGIGISRGMAFNPKLGGPGPGTSTSTQVSNCNSSSGRPSHQQPSARKQRRCWSPELHRRFVDALTQLGGPQVATPKQIRELMRVDGLTNDEVKSHLQKYRLHSRRVPNDSGGCTNKNGHGLSGSWAGQDQYSESSKPNSSPSASPEGPHQFPGLTGGTSTTGGDSMEDEDDDDEKSESYSWKDQVHRPGKDDV